MLVRVWEYAELDARRAALTTSEVEIR